MEILYATPIIISSAPVWFYPVLALILAIAAVIFVFSAVEDSFPMTATAFAILVLSLLYTAAFCNSVKTDSGRMRYEAIISEDYSAKSLYENYDVIEIRGNIVVIEEKEKIEDQERN